MKTHRLFFLPNFWAKVRRDLRSIKRSNWYITKGVMLRWSKDLDCSSLDTSFTDVCTNLIFKSSLFCVLIIPMGHETQQWESLVLLVWYFTAVVLQHGEVCMWRPDGEFGSLPQSWLLGFELQVVNHPRKGFSHWSTSQSLLTVSQTSLAVLKFYQLITLIPLLLKRDKKRV